MITEAQPTPNPTGVSAHFYGGFIGIIQTLLSTSFCLSKNHPLSLSYIILIKEFFKLCNLIHCFFTSSQLMFLIRRCTSLREWSQKLPEPFSSTCFSRGLSQPHRPCPGQFLAHTPSPYCWAMRLIAG